MVIIAAVLVRIVRTKKADRGWDQLMLVFTNVGFMGIPVIQSIYGNDGVARLSMFILMFNLFFFSYGIVLIASGEKINFKAMINPCIIGALCGLFCGTTGFHFPGVIEDTESAVRVSAFPFELSVYDSLQALNAWVGFDKVIDVGGTGLRVGGLSADFTAPGSAFSRKDDDGNYSFVVGTVNSYEDAVVRFGQHQFAFSIIWLDTAMGIIPVAAGREVFDLEKLEAGKVIGMNADIKCDFADYASWHWQKA
jgi:hypothetical protein